MIYSFAIKTSLNQLIMNIQVKQMIYYQAIIMSPSLQVYVSQSHALFLHKKNNYISLTLLIICWHDTRTHLDILFFIIFFKSQSIVVFVFQLACVFTSDFDTQKNNKKRTNKYLEEIIRSVLSHCSLIFELNTLEHAFIISRVWIEELARVFPFFKLKLCVMKWNQQNTGKRKGMFNFLVIL